MTRTGWIALALAVAGCTKAGEETADRTPEKPPGPPPDVRVELGECAGPAARFVSGARPAPSILAPPGGGAFASLTGTADVSSGSGDQELYGGLLGDQIGEMQGGFGFRAGTETTGWGTIGTGRYGTIGHGSGTGSGYGIGSGGSHGRGMRGRTASPTQVLIGSADASGNLDKNIIRRTVRRRLPAIRFCYEKQLQVNRTLAGTVVAEFVIEPTGTVSRSSATGMDAEVSSCVARVVQRIEFPRPKGGVVQVRYPFTFRITGEALAPVSPADAGPPPASGPAESPLRGHEPMLAACFGKQPAARGVAVVEMDVDASGAVQRSTVHGVDGAVAACLSAGVKALTVTGARAGVQRCPVAFGTTPAADAPGVDITATAISALGHRVADSAALAAEPPGPAKIGPLADAMREREQAIATSVVAVRGPMVVRPVDAAPMKLVSRTIVTLSMGGIEVALAAQRGSSWRFLRAVALPVVPVAVGSDGSSSAARPAAPAGGPTASVLVGKDSIWIGATGAAAEPVTVAAGPDQAARLEQALRALAQTPAFSGRRDLEIAGDDDASYRQLVAAIDTATRAGFTDWAVVAPAMLSAAPPR